MILMTVGTYRFIDEAVKNQVEKITSRPIRDLHSNKPVPPRFCDVIIQENCVFLQKKTDKNKYEQIPWEDVVYQVEAAKQEYMK